jgi:hypothetical protein
VPESGDVPIEGLLSEMALSPVTRFTKDRRLGFG